MSLGYIRCNKHRAHLVLSMTRGGISFIWTVQTSVLNDGWLLIIHFLSSTFVVSRICYGRDQTYYNVYYHYLSSKNIKSTWWISIIKFSFKAGMSAWCGLDLWLVTSDGWLLTRVTFTDGGLGQAASWWGQTVQLVPVTCTICTLWCTRLHKPRLRMVWG